MVNKRIHGYWRCPESGYFQLNSSATSNALTVVHPLKEFMQKMRHRVLCRIRQFGKVDRRILQEDRQEWIAALHPYHEGKRAC